MPVAAAKPSGACGSAASGWHVVTLEEWADATEAAIGQELPEAERAGLIAGLVAFDDKGNGDQLVCMKPFYQSGNTPAFPAGFFDLKDNTAAVGS